MPIAMNKAARVAIAASLGLAAAACQTPANQNASLDSVRQPVVERAGMLRTARLLFDGQIFVPTAALAAPARKAA